MHKGLLSACEPRFLSASAPSRLTHSPAWTFRMASAGAVVAQLPGAGKLLNLSLSHRRQLQPVSTAMSRYPQSFTHLCARMQRQSAAQGPLSTRGLDNVTLESSLLHISLPLVPF